MKHIQKVVSNGEQLRTHLATEAEDEAYAPSNADSLSVHCEQCSKESPALQSSSLEINIDKAKELTNQMDQCREAQFKSNFHQTTYGWRLMLEDTIADVDSSSSVANEASKRTKADSEVIADESTGPGNDYIYDFDLFFESYFVADGDKEKTTADTFASSEVNEDLSALASHFGWFDEELMQILLSESEASKTC